MSIYIDKETVLNRIVSLEQLARKRVYDTPTNSPCYERYVAQMQDRQQMLSIIKAVPTADVVEVRHGRWETTPDYSHSLTTYRHICSECKTFYKDIRPRGHNFCHVCGAKMDGERK